MISNSEASQQLNFEIHLKRIFEPASDKDGFRILVDSLWPRGLKKREANIDLWLRDAGPSPELRKMFNQDLQQWDEFVADYIFQLRKNKKVAKQLISLIKTHRKVSLLYSSDNKDYNSAVVLKRFLVRSIGA